MKRFRKKWPKLLLAGLVCGIPYFHAVNSWAEDSNLSYSSFKRLVTSPNLAITNLQFDVHILPDANLPPEKNDKGFVVIATPELSYEAMRQPGAFYCERFVDESYLKGVQNGDRFIGQSEFFFGYYHDRFWTADSRKLVDTVGGGDPEAKEFGIKGAVLREEKIVQQVIHMGIDLVDWDSLKITDFQLEGKSSFGKALSGVLTADPNGRPIKLDYSFDGVSDKWQVLYDYDAALTLPIPSTIKRIRLSDKGEKKETEIIFRIHNIAVSDNVVDESLFARDRELAKQKRELFHETPTGVMYTNLQGRYTKVKAPRETFAASNSHIAAIRVVLIAIILLTPVGLIMLNRFVKIKRSKQL